MAKQKAVNETAIRPIRQQSLRVTIKGLTPLLQHKWSESVIAGLREKRSGRKSKDRNVRDPEKEANEATYFDAKGNYGVPVAAIKAALIGAADNSLGLPKTYVRKALFIQCDDPGNILEMKTKAPIIREDLIRVSNTQPDLRYRPEFPPGWKITIDISYDADILTKNDILNLFNRAGFGIGIGDWRPEKGGEFGRFEIAR